MYTVIIGFDDLIEVYRMKEYNQEIKEAIEHISTYGDDCVEFVSKGEIIETMHEISSLKEMVERFDESGIFDEFYKEEDRERINNYKELLEGVAVK